MAGWSDPGAAFTAVIQLGTELAVVLYFRRDIWQIISTWVLSLRRQELRSDPAARLGWFVMIGTIPIAVLGVTLQNAIERHVRDLRLIAVTLIVFGLLLGWADRVASERRKLRELTLRDAVLMGCAQAFALVPGVSRSGGTITAALFLGYRRADAARYSFLLAIPAVFASGLLEATKIGGDAGVNWPATIVATGISFAVGLATVAWLMRFITHHSFTPFVIYRIVLGVAVLLAAGVA